MTAPPPPTAAPPARAPATTVIGAGWAGLAAAIEAVDRGEQVTVLEAARTVGGRARAVVLDRPGQPPLTLDNGQHILIGAYRQSLALMRRVGLDPAALLHRQPLTLLYPDGCGLQLPDAAPPLDMLWGLLRARGWAWADRLGLLRAALRWQLAGYRCAPGTTVAQLCRGLGPRALADLIEPLCVSALNTPPDEACAQVFLRVMKDSLAGGRGGSHLLIPKVDLGQLWPEAAVRWLRKRGATVHTGERVQVLQREPDGRWRVQASQHHAAADAVVLATPPWEASRLLQPLAASHPTVQRWCAQAHALRFEAIATVYAQAPAPLRLPQPMLALRNGPGQPAQFVFDRSQLGGPAGLLAFVVSADRSPDRDTLQAQVLAQAQQALRPCGLPEGTPLHPLQTIVEKRATFACTPGLPRPPRHLLPGLSARGDYVEGPYPATLEGAVL